MPVPSTPPLTWNESDLRFLVQEPPAEESQELEFKTEYAFSRADGSVADDSKAELLADISAMANATGGTLVIGIKESPRDPRPIASKLVGIPDVQKVRQQVESLTNAYLDVRPQPLRFNSVPLGEGNGHVLVVSVEPNLLAPSMVTFKDSGRFWVRRGWNKQIMTTDEIGHRFTTLNRLRDDAKRELSSIREEIDQEFCPQGSLITDPPPPLFAWCAFVPVARTYESFRFTSDEVRAWIRTNPYYSLYDRPQESSYTASTIASQLAPNLRGVGLRKSFQLHAEEQSVWGTARFMFEVRRDGTLLFCRAVRGVVRNSIPGCAEYNVDLGQIYEPWLHSIHLFKEVCAKLGTSTRAAVQAGIGLTRGYSVGDRSSPIDIPFQRRGEIVCEPILTDRDLDPRTLFVDWATQLANALEVEEAVSEPPWIRRAGT